MPSFLTEIILHRNHISESNIEKPFHLFPILHFSCFYIKVFTFSCLASLSHFFIPTTIYQFLSDLPIFFNILPISMELRFFLISPDWILVNNFDLAIITSYMSYVSHQSIGFYQILESQILSNNCSVYILQRKWISYWSIKKKNLC